MHRLFIEAEVLCPMIPSYSTLNQCANCSYYHGIDDGEYVLCTYDIEKVMTHE